MSTITKIIGEIYNDSLPVLTSEGLVDRNYGKFVNRLEELNYSMSATEKNAVSNFIDALKENNLLSSIKLFFPFFGNSSNVKAARVPLIGDKYFDFEDSFSSFNYLDNTKIQGITRTPATSLKVTDVCISATQLGSAVSLTKEATSNTGIEKIVKFNSDALQIRIDGSYRYSGYARKTGGTQGAFTFGGTTPTSGGSAASMYYAGAVDNSSNTGKFACAYLSVYGSNKAASTDDSMKISMSEPDLEKSMVISDTYTSTKNITSITFFSKHVISTNLAKYLKIVRDFMVALGRDTNNYSEAV